MLYSHLYEFEWDASKASTNFIKHKVQFGEASSTWGDNNGLEIPDYVHSETEERWIRIGLSNQARILVVAYCENLNAKIRIISARKATTHEQRQYHERVTI